MLGVGVVARGRRVAPHDPAARRREPGRGGQELLDDLCLVEGCDRDRVAGDGGDDRRVRGVGCRRGAHGERGRQRAGQERGRSGDEQRDGEERRTRDHGEDLRTRRGRD
jgi:hypothetical protein